MTAYRTAFGHARACIGAQPDPLGGSRVWVLPNQQAREVRLRSSTASVVVMDGIPDT